MRAIDRFLPPKRITRPEFWTDYQDKDWFKAPKSQRRLGTQRLAEELAQKSVELHSQTVERVIHEYRREYGLTQESRWKPRNEWRYTA